MAEQAEIQNWLKSQSNHTVDIRAIVSGLYRNGGIVFIDWTYGNITYNTTQKDDILYRINNRQNPDPDQIQIQGMTKYGDPYNLWIHRNGYYFFETPTDDNVMGHLGSTEDTQSHILRLLRLFPSV